MKIELLNNVTLFQGDCRDTLRSLPDNSVDSVPCDPPYALVSIVKRFGNPNAAPAKGNDAYARASAGFMGKTWDTGEVAFDPEFWREVYRVLKPGGHLAAFSASRTYHRMACAIEDAGFEIRDSLMWIYGTGFPKSMNVGKAIDAHLGAERIVTREGTTQRDGYGEDWDTGTSASRPRKDQPATAQGAEWESWGTALKPAFEPIVLARKPMSEPTVAANVLKWRTGALNIDGCRVETAPGDYATGGKNDLTGTGWGHKDNSRTEQHPAGRWPANVVTDGSDEVVGLFPYTHSTQANVPRGLQHSGRHGGVADLGKNLKEGTSTIRGHADKGGSAARFFYSAKASKADRAGSKHPTVKPIALMQWLARLITPPGGIVLDPFAGSGTTGVAAVAEGFSAILCERESEYVADIKRRIGEPLTIVSTVVRQAGDSGTEPAKESDWVGGENRSW